MFFDKITSVVSQLFFSDNDGGSVKFMFSKKATKIEKNLHRRFDSMQ